MGQKINPTGFRLPVSRSWISKWYANKRNFPKLLLEDIQIRAFLSKKLKNSGLSNIIIERPAKVAKITILAARPGIIIGKKGGEVENLKKELSLLISTPVSINIEEIKKPETDARFVSDNIAQQLEKRMMFRRVMKRSVQNALRNGAIGIKVMCSGRLNGIEIARKEWYREGIVPLHTINADIEYSFSEAKTTYGIIGVKVWIYKGEYSSN